MVRTILLCQMVGGNDMMRVAEEAYESIQEYGN